MNTKFLQKVAELKKETGKMTKDSTNPFFKSKYFDINQLLEHLEPIAESKGLLILQPIIQDEVYSQIIDIESGDKIESSIKLTQFTDPQKTGSAITYYRRYSLQSLLGLQAEDDDANKASGNTSTEKKNVAMPSSNSEDKAWLNLINKDGEKTAIFVKLLERAKTEPITVNELKKHFKISKDSLKILAENNIK